MVSLFQSGTFILNSGKHSPWKIDCDALTAEDIATLAEMISHRISNFGSVEGVPRGGLRLAEAMKKYVTQGPLLIVDDVLTTGGSMDHHRAGRHALGAVIFARGLCPAWITSIFQIVGE